MTASTSWGRDDRCLISDCARHGIPMPFSDEFLNIGIMWSLMNPGNRLVGLRHALVSLGLEKDFYQVTHRAEADAVDAARAFIAMTNIMRAGSRHLPVDELGRVHDEVGERLL